MASRELTNTNFIVFDLTQSGRQPTIYRTQVEHANHYTTDAVSLVLMSIMWDKNENSSHFRAIHATSDLLHISSAHNIPCYILVQ
jgi:hypothetical protein